MKQKYIVFKDDDAGKDLPGLKKWVNIILKNDAKGAIGLIGKYLKDSELVEYLLSLDAKKIEIFCHGYYHGHFPYIVNKKVGKQILKTEFDKTVEKHNTSLKKFRTLERKNLKTKAIAFGPQGNIWNNSVAEALEQNGFKMMFAWEKVPGGIFTIPLTDNYKQNSLDEFIKAYEENKDVDIFTLQFHHAQLSDKQFDLLDDVISFLKKQGRVFVTPSELLKIYKN